MNFDPYAGSMGRASYLLRAIVLTGVVVVLASGCGIVGQGVITDHSAASSFDARTTSLTLQKTNTGGIESVLSRDATDAAQVANVRTLLQNEVAQFHEGKYRDPAREHGMVMPGSRELESGYSRIQIDYSDLPAGGQIAYAAGDPALVDAIHSWFDRRGMAG